jgi:hypothetical protein
MSITTVLIVPHAFLKAFGTVLRPFLDRASKKTNQPSRRCLCFMYVASWAGPMTSFRFKILSSTTCTSPDEKVTRTSTYPMPDLASRISVPRFSSFALAKRPKHSWPCNSGFLRTGIPERIDNFCFNRILECFEKFANAKSGQTSYAAPGSLNLCGDCF